MRGLLLKDLYMMWKYCRSVFTIVLIFFVVSVWGKGNLFLIIYPVILSAMVPVTLMAYEESCKWNLYAAFLPCSRRDLVSSKYLLVLGLDLLISILIAGIQGLKAGGFSSFSWAAGLDFFLAPFCLGLAAPAFMLPFFYQFGTGKGRLVYIGIICLLTCLVYSAQQVGADEKVLGAGFALSVDIRLAKAAVTLFCIAFFALSWGISVFIYSRKELS